MGSIPAAPPYKAGLPLPEDSGNALFAAISSANPSQLEDSPPRTTPIALIEALLDCGMPLCASGRATSLFPAGTPLVGHPTLETLRLTSKHSHAKALESMATLTKVWGLGDAKVADRLRACGVAVE